MTNKLIWRWLIPTMARLPVLRKLAVRIYTKKLAGIVVQSINHYKEVVESDLTLFKACPVSRELMAMSALMPIAMIYGYVNDSQEVKTNEEGR